MLKRFLLSIDIQTESNKATSTAIVEITETIKWLVQSLIDAGVVDLKK